MIKASELPKGSHFWAVMDEKLVMMMKDKYGDCYVCGGWECPIRENHFEIIELVPRRPVTKMINFITDDQSK